MEALWATILFSGFALEVIIRQEEFRSYGVVAFADLIEEEIKEAIEDERQERLASERQWDDLER